MDDELNYTICERFILILFERYVIFENLKISISGAQINGGIIKIH